MKNSDILSYNPDLQINTKVNMISSKYYDDTEVSYSKRSTVLNQFDIHRPSSKIAQFLEIENNIKDYKSTMKEKLASNPIAIKYFNSSDSESAKDILKSNCENMNTGSTVLEAYNMLENIEEEVKNIKDSFIISIYGKDVDIDSVVEIDNTYIDKMGYYESNGEHEYVNYFNLYYDTQVSFLIGEYVTKTSQELVNLTLINENDFQTKATKESEVVLKNSFDITNRLLSSDLYKHDSNKDNLLIALKNIFISKQTFNLYLDSFSDLFSISEVFETIYEIKEENINILNEKLENLVQVILLSSISKKDIVKTLNKKSKVRGFFNK